MRPPDSSTQQTDATFRAQHTTREAFAYTGLDAAQVQGAILAGGVTPELLIATARVLPAPRPILLIDTLEPLRELEERVGTSPVLAELAGRCTTLVLAGGAEPFCLQAYLATWEFLLANGLSPGAVVLSGTGHAGDETLRGAYSSVADLVISHSTQFLARVDRRSLPAAQVLRWALFLSRTGCAFHALKLLYALRDVVARQTLAATIIELWATLGCPEPAFDWFDALEPEQRQQCEEPLRQAAAARELVLLETLEQNRAAFARRSISLPEPTGGERTVHLALLPSLPCLPAPGLGARRERYPCLFRIAGGQLVELSPPSHPRTVCELLSKALSTHETAALIGSLTSATHFRSVAESQPVTGLPGWQQQVYVVEEDPDVVQAFASTLPLDDVLGEGRFEFLLGPGATERFERLLLDTPLLPLPSKLLVAARREQLAALVRVANQRAERSLVLGQGLAERYTAERVAQLAGLIGPASPRPLRILVLTNLFTTVLQYQARDMVAAFESLGHEVRLLVERRSTHLMTSQVILQTISDFDPDLLYTLDVLRAGLNGLPQHLPVVCWMQDELPRLSNRAAIAEIGPSDFTFCLSSEWTRRYRDLGYPHTALLSMAADPNVYAPRAEREPKGSDAARGSPPPIPAVVMITHVPRPSASVPGLFGQLEPILRAEGKMRPTAPDYDREIRTAALALGIELGPPQFDAARRSIHLLARYLELTSVARWLVEAGIEVGLYGSGWSDIPDLAGHARGVLRSGPELSAVYSEAKVVLHINGTMNRHVRVFECLAAGGLPLCRSHASDYEPGELNDALRIGQEVLCFDGRRDLLDKLAQLLGDEPERQSIARAGRQRVLAEHCMKHRMQSTLDEIRQQLCEAQPQSGLRRAEAAPLHDTALRPALAPLSV